MNLKAQRISPETETSIREVIKTNKEVIRQLQLANQALAAQLPAINKKPDEDKGYIVDPKYGKKLWYDLKKKAQYERSLNKIKIVKGAK